MAEDGVASSAGLMWFQEPQETQTLSFWRLQEGLALGSEIKCHLYFLLHFCLSTAWCLPQQDDKVKTPKDNLRSFLQNQPPLKAPAFKSTITAQATQT